MPTAPPSDRHARPVTLTLGLIVAATIAALTLGHAVADHTTEAGAAPPPGSASAQPWEAASWYAPGAWGCPTGVIMRDGISAEPNNSGPIAQGGPLVHVHASVPIEINGGDGIVGIVSCAAVTVDGETMVQESRHVYGYQQASEHNVVALTDPVALPAEMGATDHCTLSYRGGLDPRITYSCAQPSGSPTVGRITVDARTLTLRPGVTA